VKRLSTFQTIILGSSLFTLTASPALSETQPPTNVAESASHNVIQVNLEDEARSLQVPAPVASQATDTTVSLAPNGEDAETKRLAKTLPVLQPAVKLSATKQVLAQATLPQPPSVPSAPSQPTNVLISNPGGVLTTSPIIKPSSPGAMVPNPSVSVTDNGAGAVPNISQIGAPAAPDGSTPTTPAVPNQVPTSLPRAVPPPVGDISTSSYAAPTSQVDFGTTQRIPRLLLRDAPVREVLSLLARSVGYNVVFTSEAEKTSDTQQAAAPDAKAKDTEGPRISLDIEDEAVQDIFNSVLRVGALQANRIGRTIYVGVRLPVEARNVIVRSLRLNQVNVVDAANYLSAQGAESQVPITKITIQQVGTGLNARDVEIREPDIKAISAKEGTGTLLLSGLSIVTDNRLNAITMIGEPKKIEIATGLLTQLDGRRRQVIVNVKIIDINLNNTDIKNASFSFGVGDNFFSVDGGAATFNFGPSRPPQSGEVRNSPFYVSPTVVGLNVPGEPFFDSQSNAQYNAATGTVNSSIGVNATTVPPGTTSSSLQTAQQGITLRAPFGTTSNPFQPGITGTQEGQFEAGSPSLYRFPTRFLSQLQYQIDTQNAKILTDPTLVVQEGQTAKVDLTQQVIGNVTSTTTSDGNLSTQTVTANIVNAGLELNVSVERIDDNGFITLNVNPRISSPQAPTDLSVGGATNQITLVNTRSVESGSIRLRDGQTLILSGVIQDIDRTTVTKVPILGDIPILGALFRRTSKANARQEVIVLLTPQIMDDSDRATWGYGYTPGPGVQQLLKK
jgi:type IV pilus assembly protein PilQ